MVDSNRPPAEIIRGFEQSLADRWSADSRNRVPITIAVSGGADSIALLRAMARLSTEPQKLVLAAHINHGLRGAESDADQKWLETTCKALQIQLFVRSHQVIHQENNRGEGLESRLRQLRYQLLIDIAKQTGSRYLATAHTLDDVVETVLFRIFRGTGLAGLKGIPRIRLIEENLTLIRPQLHCTRESVEDYLLALGQDFRVDSSNESLDHSRNRIRHQLLPLIRGQLNANIDGSIARLVSQAHDAMEIIDELVEELFKSAVESSSRSVRIDRAAVVAARKYLVTSLFLRIWQTQRWPLQEMTYEKWSELAAWAVDASPSSQRINLPGNLKACHQGQSIVIERN